ncbi:C6 transcription factor [Penicillium angulare]|uniref:C6 transcription factor n=1 Tax=Penicillium angulare TaxID=116970 RepID=A0A9W9FX76_9EURO|nr:C6 transcription factor [Penicillium angulare]
MSRRQVLQDAQVEEAQLPQRETHVQDTAELLFTPQQVEQLMMYHQEYIAWTHNVVHLPLFRAQCAAQSTGNTTLDGTWVALFYAMLAVSRFVSYAPVQAGGIRYHDFCVQAICLLIYIGHNIGQSDRISVLLASAGRIAQCLGLHRLGPVKATAESQETESLLHKQSLIDREVSKRAWWFLVRQDWLQIPFNNTYSIHPTQFTTPMPKNCDDDISCMIVQGEVLDHGPEHYTQGSYTSVLNHVSGIVWKLQDRMCQHESPNEDEESLRSLYSEALQADQELRKLISKVPSFLKDESAPSESVSVQIEQQRGLLYLGLAHKVSCLPIMRRHLASFLSLPKTTHAYIVTNLWTANTQVLTAALWLLFELIFSREESAQIYEAEEIRELASRSSDFLRANQHKSRIAKRGVTLIESLLEIDQAVTIGDGKEFSLRDIISRVVNSDTYIRPDLSSEALNASSLDFISVDGLSWEDLMNAFIDV